MRELTEVQEIERSIITKFRKPIWDRFLDGVNKYSMVEDGDKIAVCISGGKDSFLLAKLMQELKRHSETKFELEFISMDPGYDERNREKIKENAKRLGVPIQVFSSNIFSVAEKLDPTGGLCYLCARMRRGFLYSRAQELGCNKIALGHHMSDVIETTLMGMMYGGQIEGMLPKIVADNFDDMQLIRPMYCVLEDDIKAWASYNDLEFIACACKKTTSLPSGVQPDSARQDVKKLIREMKEKNPNVEACLFHAIHNVQLDTLPCYKRDGETYFMEKFERDKERKKKS